MIPVNSRSSSSLESPSSARHSIMEIIVYVYASSRVLALFQQHAAIRATISSINEAASVKPVSSACVDAAPPLSSTTFNQRAAIWLWHEDDVLADGHQVLCTDSTACIGTYSVQSPARSSLQSCFYSPAVTVAFAYHSAAATLGDAFCRLWLTEADVEHSHGQLANGRQQKLTPCSTSTTNGNDMTVSRMLQIDGQTMHFKLRCQSKRRDGYVDLSWFDLWIFVRHQELRNALKALSHLLSTLGGAHSTLGDGGVDHHSRRALQLARQQVVLARLLDDPETEAMSLCYLAVGLARQHERQKAAALLCSIRSSSKTVQRTIEHIVTKFKLDLSTKPKKGFCVR